MDDDNRGISFFYLFFASFFSFFFLRGKRKKEGRKGKAPFRVCLAYHFYLLEGIAQEPVLLCKQFSISRIKFQELIDITQLALSNSDLCIYAL